jgi:hypothetical protein
MSRLLPSPPRPYPVSIIDNGNKPNTTTRYLDISSAFRDRSQYPDTCDFVVQVNNNNSTSNPVGSNDPIVLGFPYDAGLLSGGSTNTQFALSVNSSTVVNFYRGSYICIGTYYAKIIDYDNLTQIATVDASTPYPGPPPPALTQYTIRYNLPFPLTNAPLYQDATPLVPLGGVNEFVPGPLAQAIILAQGPDALLYKFVLFQGANFPTTAQWGYLQSYRFDAINNVYIYRVGNPNPSPLVTNPYQFGPIPAGSTYEIFNFSYDNVRPIKYQGTDLVQTPSCQLRLISILLPSLPLLNGYGGHLYDYSHLYVSVQSAKARTYNNCMISNTPASSNALFQVPVTFLYFPTKSFYSLIFTGMTQQVLFRESDDLRIQVLLPNGEVLKFEQPNSLLFFPGFNFPIPCNPFTEIQLNTEVTRLP